MPDVFWKFLLEFQMKCHVACIHEINQRNIHVWRSRHSATKCMQLRDTRTWIKQTDIHESTTCSDSRKSICNLCFNIWTTNKEILFYLQLSHCKIRQWHQRQHGFSQERRRGLNRHSMTNKPALWAEVCDLMNKSDMYGSQVGRLTVCLFLTAWGCGFGRGWGD